LFTANDFSQHVFYSLCILGFMALEKILAFFLILRNILEDDELGLDTETIERVWRPLEQELPRTILECGSGASTIVFAKHLSTRRASLNSRFQLISLEQNPDWIDKIRARLERLDLATYGKDSSRTIV
jgi:hypothetical protein